MATTALISDMHLGAGSGTDVLRRKPILERLLEATDGRRPAGAARRRRRAPRAARSAIALDACRPFFEEVGEAFAGREVVLVPGNHDHRLLGPWLERSRDEERPGRARGGRRRAPPGGPLDRGLARRGPARGPLPGLLGARRRLRDPRPLPRQPRDAADHRAARVATVDRLGGRPTGKRTAPTTTRRSTRPSTT